MNLKAHKDRKVLDAFLSATSFKNVSGNWQFNGDITPERAFKVIQQLSANDGWISVNDDLPNDTNNIYVTVLAFDGLERLVCSFNQATGKWNYEGEITHWHKTPLPQSPKS